MTIERINYLYQNGHISAFEHSELTKNYHSKAKNSILSYITLITGFLGWILMLTYTQNGQTVGLLSNGESRLFSGLFFSTLTIFLFLVTRKRSSNLNEKINYAYVGLGVAIAIQFIAIPVLFMSM